MGLENVTLQLEHAATNRTRNHSTTEGYEWSIFKALFRVFGAILCSLIIWVAFKCWGKKIGYGVKAMKFCRWLCFILTFTAFVLYNILAFSGLYEVEVVGEVTLGCLALLSLFIPFAESVRKIPPLCCGRRHWLFKKQTKLSLIEVLNRIDENLPGPIESQTIERRGREYLSAFLEGLSKQFSSEDISVILTGSGAEKFGVPLSTEWINTSKDVEDEHPLLTDFDFMFCLDSLHATYDEESSLKLISFQKGLQPGYAFSPR